MDVVDETQDVVDVLDPVDGVRSVPKPMLNFGYRVLTRLTAAISHEDDWYVARCLEVEVTTRGRSEVSLAAQRLR